MFSPCCTPSPCTPPPGLLVLTADSFFTVRLLRRTHNVDLLGIPNLLAALR